MQLSLNKTELKRYLSQYAMLIQTLNMELSSIIGEILDSIATQNDTNNTKNFNSFTAQRKPQITIYDYASRIREFTNDEMMIVALIYLDRVTQMHPEILINSLNVHRLFLASVLIANKFFQEDRRISNKFYAKLGGIQNKEMNILEKEFLEIVGYNLYVEEQEFSKYQNLLVPKTRKMLRSTIF